MADTTTRKTGRSAAVPAPTTIHTPGPWAWQGYALRAATPDPESSAVHTILAMECSGSGYLASDPAGTSAELLADHRLIAAAPTMFEALTGARAALVLVLGTVDAALSAVGTQGGVL